MTQDSRDGDRITKIAGHLDNGEAIGFPANLRCLKYGVQGGVLTKVAFANLFGWSKLSLRLSQRSK